MMKAFMEMWHECMLLISRNARSGRRSAAAACKASTNVWRSSTVRVAASRAASSAT